MSANTLIWSIIAAFGAADCLLLPVQGLSISGRWYAVLIVVLLCGVSFLYRRRSPAIACVSMSAAQMVAFSHVAGLITYAAMAASPFPMADGLLGQADAALGFDWVKWFAFVNAHPIFHLTLALAYASIPFQAVALVAYFAFNDMRRVHELLVAAMLSMVLVTPIMIFFPAIGAWSHHGVGMVEPWRGDIIALRSHTGMTIAETNGIISFPSYHTVLGVLLANMARGRKFFLPVFLLNLLLIMATLSEGAHFGVDTLSGFAVAFISLAATQFLLGRCSDTLVAVASGPGGTYAAGRGSGAIEPERGPIERLRDGGRPSDV